MRASSPSGCARRRGLQYEGYVAAHEAIQEAIQGERVDGSDPAAQLRSLLQRATDAERELVLDARRVGEVSSGSADEMLREIESRALRDFG